MKKFACMLLNAGLVMGLSSPASAWYQETHKRIVIDAVEYMKNHPESTNYTKLA